MSGRIWTNFLQTSVPRGDDRIALAHIYFRNRISKTVLGNPIVCVACVFFSLGLQNDINGQGQTDTIAITGQDAPDGNGSFSTFSNPVINGSGQTAFKASLTNTIGLSNDDGGIFRGNGGVNTQIAREGQVAPNGNGTYTFFGNPVLNDSGHAAFFAYLTDTTRGFDDDHGIFSGYGGGITQLAREFQSVGNGRIAVFSAAAIPTFNNSGQAAFRAFLSDTSDGGSDDDGIFRGSGFGLTQIAREGQAAPDGNGKFSGLTNPELNNAGQAAFFATLAGTSGVSNDDSGIFRGNIGGITQIAREGQIAPNGNGTFSGFFNPTLNDSGQTAFIANLTGTNGGFNDNSGIFRGNGFGLTQIAREGQTAPDGNGTLSAFGIPVLNNLGQAAFFATLAGTSGESSDDSGIFRSSGFGITQIAREGQTAPDGNGIFSSFFNATINNSGQTAFLASLTGTSGGSDDRGIYTGDGIDSFRVAREGDSVAGSTISSFSFFLPDKSVNDFGQIAYRAVLANGNEVIRRWTPDLHWRTNYSGSWGTSSNWTLGLNPAEVHDVYLDPEASLTVYGPTTDTNVHNLFVGTDGVTSSNGQVTLNLQQGRTIDVDNIMIIGSSGTLTGDGRITGATGVFNDGRVLANNVIIDGPINSLINGGTGVIDGNGRVHANIFNTSGGNIRANNSNVLQLTGPALNNLGRIEVIGGELQVTSNVQNNGSSSLITGRNATMRFNGGVNNGGSMAFSFGTSDVFGDIDNDGGIISIGGGAEVTFYDDITQNGSFEVVATGSRISSAVVFGDFSGAGGFTGGGDVFLLGDLRPGNSPASVLMDGNLYMGVSTDSMFEFGGLTQGEFDQLIVTGDLSLAGDLSVGLIDGFQLGIDQEFLIADVGTNLVGQFAGLNEGSLVGNFGGHDLFISYSAGDGNDVALFTSIPEPGAIGLLLLGSVLLLGRRRRRK